MFPLSAAGCVRLRDSSVDRGALVNDLALRLRSQKPSFLEIHGDLVRFEAGPLRPVWSTNLLTQFSRGTIQVSQKSSDVAVFYHVRFNEVFIAATMLALSAAFQAQATGWTKLLLFLTIWSFLLGTNYAFGVFRLRRLLRRAIREAPRARQEP